MFASITTDASTKLAASWKNPNYSGQQFKKILVVGMSNNLTTRSDFEVALAAKITRPGIVGVAGTDILLRPTAGPLDLTYLREQIAAYKIDAVIVSRLVKVETKTTYFPRSTLFSSLLRHVLRLLRNRVSGGLLARLSGEREEGAS